MPTTIRVGAVRADLVVMGVGISELSDGDCFPPLNTPSLESMAEVMICIKPCCDLAHRGISSYTVSYFGSLG